MLFEVEVKVWLKPSVFDPQGNAVEKALQGLGHEGINNVRIGKYMNLEVEAQSKEEADAKVREMCDTVLCNLVIETYDFNLTAAGTAATAAAAGTAQQASTKEQQS